MLKHYLTTSLRHLRRHKGTTAINVLSLAFGLVTFVVSYSFVMYMNNGDLNHEKSDRTYIITQRADVGAEVGAMAPMSGWSLAPYIREDYPELETVARATAGQEMAIATRDGDQVRKNFTQVSYADPDFLTIFEIPFVKGDARKALESPHSAVITEEYAKQLFGDADPMGRTLLLNNRETVRITGVMQPPPEPSHIATKGARVLLQFNLLVSMDTLDAFMQAAGPEAALLRNRFFQMGITYVVFKEKSAFTPEQLESDLKQFSTRHVPPEIAKIDLKVRHISETYAALGEYTYKSDRTGLDYSVTNLIIGALALVAACVNYANLLSAQVSTRVKELAMHRVVGASLYQVLAQSFCESLLVIIAAACVALALLPVGMGVLSSTMNMDFSTVLWTAPEFWFWLAVILLCVAFIACAYPAWVTMRIQPAAALQSGQVPRTKRRFLRFLVVCQFVAASVLFVVTYVMIQQNERMLPERDANKDPIVIIGTNLKDAGIDTRTLQDELRRQSSVKAVSAIDYPPGNFGKVSRGIVMLNAEAIANRWLILAPAVDYDFFNAMDIPLLAGRVFLRDMAGDLADGGNVVIDRALAETYGWRNPKDAISKSIYVATSSAKDSAGVPRTVIGVVENKMLVAMTMMGGSSTYYSLDPSRATSVLVRISKDNVQGAVSDIDAVWDRLANNIPLKRMFMDEQFEAGYRMLRSSTRIVPIFAVTCMLIGVMGLAGIATHAIAQRRFEIGVRRTLGATARQVLRMLLKDFAKPILIANLVAWPIAFVFAKAFTAAFTDRVAINMFPFLLSLAIGLGVAWLAVIRQATNAARMNPAAVLRHD